MSTATYESLLYEVLPYAQNCAEPAAVNALRNATIEFCRTTMFHQVDIDPISVTAGEANYEFDLPRGTELVKVVELFYKNRRLEARTRQEVMRQYTTNYHELTGTPKSYLLGDPNTLTLVLTPDEDADEAITGRVALIPTRDSTGVDSTVTDRFAEVLAAGALARLYNTPNQPYFDPNGALVRRKQFDSGVAQAKVYVNSAMTAAPMRVRFNRVQ